MLLFRRVDCFQEDVVGADRTLIVTKLLLSQKETDTKQTKLSPVVHIF